MSQYKNYSIFDKQDFGYWLCTSILDCFGHLLSYYLTIFSVDVIIKLQIMLLAALVSFCIIKELFPQAKLVITSIYDYKFGILTINVT